jgi:hypothetical protein
MRSGTTFAFLIALVLLAAASFGNGAQLRVALEDRADRNPRQVALSVELAGAATGFVISWTQRLN